MELPERIIGSYDAGLPGPLVIILGGMHGNEKAGVNALTILFNLLSLEPIHNRDFKFRGRLIGLRGNRRALAEGRRFINNDLNRQWTKEHVEFVLQTPKSLLKEEDLEQREILELIHEEVRSYQPSRLVVLDLHTTTASGGIFSIATDDPNSISLGVNMYAPVVKGMLNGIHGTTLHYFVSENFPCQTIPITFESGQHANPRSAKRALAAIVNLLRSEGCVSPDAVETKHDELLRNYCIGLPKVVEMLYVHRVYEEDRFVMKPGYCNFQSVEEGEILAKDRNGYIKAQEEGLILMPLYQKQGEDGFFIVRPVTTSVAQT